MAAEAAPLDAVVLGAGPAGLAAAAALAARGLRAALVRPACSASFAVHRVFAVQVHQDQRTSRRHHPSSIQVRTHIYE
jgi:2-polyprenyl-6-methoxyphenol hydroxylase-like FAD-dependent oxidoreductase